MSLAHPLVCLLVFAAVTSAPSLAGAQDTDACISASEKALALKKADKLIDARTSLSICAASACPDAVRTSCQQRLAAVNQSIPSIVFFAKDGSGRDLAAVKLTIDGAVYTEHLGGSSIALNPGEHEFRFEVLGQAPVVQRFVLHQGEQNRRENVVIGPTAVPLVAPPAAPSIATTPPTETAIPSADQGAASGSNPRRTAGFAIGGIGLVSLAAGAVFGGLSLVAHSNYEKNCGSNLNPPAPADQCTMQGVTGETDAALKGNLSTAFFIAGGVVTAAGAVLVFTAPKSGTNAQVGLGLGSILMKGQF
jgi:hypothetical protein